MINNEHFIGARFVKMCIINRLSMHNFDLACVMFVYHLPNKKKFLTKQEITWQAINGCSSNKKQSVCLIKRNTLLSQYNKNNWRQ